MESVEQKERNRYAVLACCAACLGLSGALYVWSVFRNPLMAAHGWDATAVTLAYSLYDLMTFSACLLSGALMRRVKTRTLCLVGGISFGAGWFLTGYAAELWQLYLAFSLFGGFGDGLVYNSCISASQKWFPDKRGMASGVCLASVALAQLVFAPVGEILVSSFDVTTAFNVCGAIFFTIRVGLSFGIRAPEPGYVPKGVVAVDLSNAAQRTFLTLRQALRQPLFYLLFSMMLIVSVSGLMIISQASAIATDTVGLSASQGAMIVSAMALASLVGRFAFGALSDRIGRLKTLAIVIALMVVVMAVVLPSATTFAIFAVGAMLACGAFGAMMAVMPAVVGDAFGAEDFGMIWAVMFGAFTAGSFIGPLAAAAVQSATGSFVLAFYLAAALLAVGLALIPFAGRCSKRLNARKAQGCFR